MYHALTEEQFSKAAWKRLRRFSFPEFDDSEEEARWFSSKFQADVVCPGTHFVTIEELVNSEDNEDYTQFDIVPGRVSNLLHNSDKTGLLQGQGLLLDPEIFFTLDEFNQSGILAPFIIGSGRHRLVSLLTILEAKGFEFDMYKHWEIRVIYRVFPDRESLLRAICGSNGSRNMAGGEKDQLKAQYEHEDLDVTSAKSICEHVSKAKTKTSAQRIFGMAVASLKIEGLTPTTASLIGRGYLKAWSKVGIQEVEAEELLSVVAAALPTVLTKFEGNISRQQADITKRLIKATITPGGKLKKQALVEASTGRSL